MTRQVKTYNPNHIFVDTNVLIGAYSGDARYQSDSGKNTLVTFNAIMHNNSQKIVPLQTNRDNMSREQIIASHKSLFWYTPEDEKQNISDALLVERILNDGTLDDYRELVNTLGGKRVAEVFFSATGRQKQNYYPEIYHFFSLVLKKYA